MGQEKQIINQKYNDDCSNYWLNVFELFIKMLTSWSERSRMLLH